MLIRRDYGVESSRSLHGGGDPIAPTGTGSATRYCHNKVLLSCSTLPISLHIKVFILPQLLPQVPGLPPGRPVFGNVLSSKAASFQSLVSLHPRPILQHKISYVSKMTRKIYKLHEQDPIQG